MSRHRERRVPAVIDARGVAALSATEIRAILRGAEDLIAQGGRSLLCKILKGSRSKDVLEHGLDDNPSYGFYGALSNDEVMARIDWTISHDLLRIEYFGRSLPLLGYTDAGLAIEIELVTDEHLEELRKMAGAPVDLPFLLTLQEMPRQSLWRLFDKIEATRNPAFVPVLQTWAPVAYKKVRTRLNALIGFLSSHAPPDTGS